MRKPFSPERGFNYAKPIRITNRTTKLTAFQITINLNTSNFAFEKVSSNGADIRFKDANGKALGHWIESWTSTSAKIWVKLDELEDYEERIIWLIYGNSEAKTGSNGNNTFFLFDDFLGDSIDDEKWDCTNPPSVSDSKARSTSTTVLKSTSIFDFPQPVAVMIYVDIDAMHADKGLFVFSSLIKDRNDIVVTEGMAWYPEGIYDRHVYGVNSRYWPGTNKGAALGESRHTFINIPPSKISYAVSGVRTFNDTRTDVNDYPTCSTRYYQFAVGQSPTVIYLYWIAIRKYLEISPLIDML